MSTLGVGLGVAGALLAAVAAAALIMRKRRRPQPARHRIADKRQQQLLANAIASLGKHYAQIQGEVTQAQIRVLQVSALTFDRSLGHGVQGQVIAVTVQGSESEWQQLAVKLPMAGPGTTASSMAAQGMVLLNEALMLAAADGHPSILPLAGLLLGPKPEHIGFCTPLMVNGSLKQYLQRCRPTANVPALATVTLGDVATMARALASAMMWLERRTIIHRDVAARNVLVGAEGAADVRLADLGAARILGTGVYTASTEHTPVRWMAPESLSMGTFSHRSDAWAFGVLLWEISSLGQTPYRLLSNGEVLGAIERGERLEQEPLALPSMYRLMKRCWSPSPRQRPAFETLYDELRAAETAVMALAGVRGAHLGPDGALVYPDGPARQPEGPALDGQGYVFGPVEQVQLTLEPVVGAAPMSNGREEERCPDCRARIKWCTCGTSTETRL